MNKILFKFRYCLQSSRYAARIMQEVMAVKHQKWIWIGVIAAVFAAALILLLYYSNMSMPQYNTEGYLVRQGDWSREGLWTEEAPLTFAERTAKHHV